MTTTTLPRAWHVGERHTPQIPAPVATVAADRCWASGTINSWYAVCTRPHGHTGRHAWYGINGQVLAVWP